MNVAQIINAADAATFRRFKSMLNAAVGVSGTMCAVVAPITNNFGEDDGTVRYEVDGDDGSGAHWSLSFTGWSEWKLMDVIDRTGSALSTDMLAMCLYYEMTWHGWPEDMIERRDELFDLAEAVERAHD